MVSVPIFTTLGMTPAAYRRRGNGMSIRYTVVDSQLGRLLVPLQARGSDEAETAPQSAYLHAGENAVKVRLTNDSPDELRVQVNITWDENPDYQPDLYLLEYEQPFVLNYVKGMVGLWCWLCIIVGLAVTWSTWSGGGMRDWYLIVSHALTWAKAMKSRIAAGTAVQASSSRWLPCV